MTEGKWIINSDGYYPYCSVCGKECYDDNLQYICPNCGADLSKSTFKLFLKELEYLNNKEKL